MLTYLFPGQGAQHKGMGEGLFDEFPALTDNASDILGFSIRELCLKDEESKLNNTRYTQPALYVVNALSYLHQRNQNGTEPDFLAGHSLGEYNALQAAGAISFEDGVRLVKKRGELMSKAENGAMAALLGLSDEDVRLCIEENHLSQIDIANYNSPTQIVISGPSGVLAEAQSRFETAGAMFIPLNTSGAFHSRYMQPAQEEFASFLADFSFSELGIPVISNVHARPYANSEVADNLAKQITHSVRWTDSMLYLLSHGVSDFVELGVGNVLTKLMGQIERYYTEEYKSLQQYDKQAQDAPDSPSDDSQSTPIAVQTATEDRVQHAVEKIEAWNRTYPVGMKVTVKGYSGTMRTRTPAVLLFGHRAALYMDEYNGYFSLEDVAPLGDAA